MTEGHFVKDFLIRNRSGVGLLLKECEGTRIKTIVMGRRRRWDSNPRGLFTLHDFQSCSLGHYETPPGRAERVGFEPTRAIHPTAFRERHFRPLRHLSTTQYSIPCPFWQAFYAPDSDSCS